MKISDSISWLESTLDPMRFAGISRSVEDCVGDKLLRVSEKTPRDLFNYSKALKNLGQLSLRQHEAGFVRFLSTVVNDSNGIRFLLDGANGGLWCPDILFAVWDVATGTRGRIVYMTSEYNSKNNYTLEILSDSVEPITVFTDEGRLTEDAETYFLDLQQNL